MWKSHAGTWAWALTSQLGENIVWLMPESFTLEQSVYSCVGGLQAGSRAHTQGSVACHSQDSRILQVRRLSEMPWSFIKEKSYSQTWFLVRLELHALLGGGQGEVEWFLSGTGYGQEQREGCQDTAHWGCEEHSMDEKVSQRANQLI
jgi:hypothetical protein